MSFVKVRVGRALNTARKSNPLYPYIPGSKHTGSLSTYNRNSRQSLPLKPTVEIAQMIGWH